MDAGFAIIGTAAGIGLVHTALGVDHTLPFVALARARQWSLRKTLLITATCGIGHVLASLALGALGIALGWGMGQMEATEVGRGPWAAWALVAFGAAYLLWGLRRGWRRRAGVEMHGHGGHLHIHQHGERPHGHAAEAGNSRTSFWVLFAIFILGPCEPLIPLFILPASQGDWSLAIWTALAFGVATVATMLLLVGLAQHGVARLRVTCLEHWAEAVAGTLIAASGLAVLYLGV